MKKLLALLVWLAFAQAAHATPQLFVYRGADCSGVAALPQFNAMVNRKVDGVDDFLTFNDPSSSLADLPRKLSCWQGLGYQLNLEVPLGFYSGGSTADIAAGKLDSYFQGVGSDLVSHGFANAYIRLGEENNLANGWPWEGQGGNFASAFQREAKVLHAVPGSNFKIEYNPSIGQDENANFPGAAYVDVMSHDGYGSSWMGDCSQPLTWTCQLNAWWGFSSVGTFWSTIPQSISEGGVGSRGDGHGYCNLTTATGCDGGAFMASYLADVVKYNLVFFTYWDVNAGDYNSQISDGSRPGEAWAFVDVFGSANLKSILHAHDAAFTAQTVPTVTCVDPTGAVACHLIVRQNGPGHFVAEIWAGSAHPSVKLAWTSKTTNANLYNPTAGTSPVIPIGPENSVALSLEAGGTRVLAISQ